MTRLAPIIATWLVSDSPEDESQFPQVRGRSSTAAFQAVYWRCVICFFATLARFDSSARRVFFTNVEHLPIVDGCSIRELLDKMHVEIRLVPITRRLKHPSIKSWGNQFYILDIIQDAERNLQFDTITILDADCVWVAKTDDFTSDIRRYGVLTLDMAYRTTEVVNGATRRDMRSVARLLDNSTSEHIPHYCGGEFFACTNEMLKPIRMRSEEVWKLLLGSNPPRLREEAHLLSVVYDLLGISPGTANSHVKRMWTTFHYHNVTTEDLIQSRCIWHLPSEKTSGFQALFRDILQPNSRFWLMSDDTLAGYLADTMGLPRRSPRKWVRDVAFKIVERLSSLVH